MSPKIAPVCDFSGRANTFVGWGGERKHQHFIKKYVKMPPKSNPNFL